MHFMWKKVCDMPNLPEICEKCGNKRNMGQSHFRIKLTCLMTSSTNKQGARLSQHANT